MCLSQAEPGQNAGRYTCNLPLTVYPGQQIVLTPKDIAELGRKDMVLLWKVRVSVLVLTFKAHPVLTVPSRSLMLSSGTQTQAWMTTSMRRRISGFCLWLLQRLQVRRGLTALGVSESMLGCALSKQGRLLAAGLCLGPVHPAAQCPEHAAERLCDGRRPASGP